MALKSVGSESESESMTITSGSSGDGVAFCGLLALFPDVCEGDKFCF